jgi:hypothetical protein
MQAGLLRRPGRRSMLLMAAALTVAAAAGIVSYLVGGGSASSASGGPSPAPSPLTALRSHQLLSPECTPVAGPRWTAPGTTLITSDLYEVFAIHMSCKQASTWTRKLAHGTVPVKRTGNISDVHGPAGWSCGGWPDKFGHAYAGGCRRGRSAFGWNWNVANRRVVWVPTENGGLMLQKLAGTDAESIIRPLTNGHYRLEVLNTSGVGFLDSFTWAPPSGLKLTRISKVSGADCSLVAGKLSCVANLHPPGCLCDGTGGDLTIELTLVPQTGGTKPKSDVTYGTQGSDFEITKMTPVPYLIPGTPQEARRRGGL